MFSGIIYPVLSVFVSLYQFFRPSLPSPLMPLSYSSKALIHLEGLGALGPGKTLPSAAKLLLCLKLPKKSKFNVFDRH